MVELAGFLLRSVQRPSSGAPNNHGTAHSYARRAWNKNEFSPRVQASLAALCWLATGVYHSVFGMNEQLPVTALPLSQHFPAVLRSVDRNPPALAHHRVRPTSGPCVQIHICHNRKVPQLLLFGNDVEDRLIIQGEVCLGDTTTWTSKR